MIELEYSSGHKVILFLCDWYDPVKGVIYDRRHGTTVVDVIAGKYIRRYEPFILASQAHQVCYVPHVTSKRKKDEYYTVLKIKARSYVDEVVETDEDLNDLYQVENEQPPLVIEDADLDEISTIPSVSNVQPSGMVQLVNEEEEDLEDDEEESSDDSEED